MNNPTGEQSPSVLPTAVCLIEKNRKVIGYIKTV